MNLSLPHQTTIQHRYKDESDRLTLMDVVHVVNPLREFILTGRLRAFAMMRAMHNKQNSTTSEKSENNSPLQRLRRSIRSRSTSGDAIGTRIADYITSAAEVVAGHVNLVAAKPSHDELTQAVLRSSIHNLSIFSRLTLHKIVECVMSSTSSSSSDVTLSTVRRWNRLASTTLGLSDLYVVCALDLRSCYQSYHSYYTQLYNLTPKKTHSNTGTHSQKHFKTSTRENVMSKL